MINLIFREGNRHVDPVWDTRPSLVRSCTTIVESKVSRLSCPNHRSRSRATLLVDVRPGSTSWGITDFCCERFCQIISQNMPHPWKQSHASEQLDQVA